jgi:hypothetical protein
VKRLAPVRRFLGRVKRKVLFQLKVSRCFDAEWYLERYPDVATSGLSPWVHYDTIGWRKGFDPSPYFWSAWYLEQYQDVAASGINPLIHYEIYGSVEGRTPSLVLDSAWHLANCRIKPKGLNRLANYLGIKRTESVDANEQLALEAFKRGDSGFNTHESFHALLDRRIKRSGQQAYFKGLLLDGRSFAKEAGIAVQENDELKAIARSIADEGAHCLPPYLAEFKDVFILPGSTLILTKDGIINDEITAATSIIPPLKQQKLWDRVWVKDGRIAIRYTVEISPRIKAGIHLFKEHEQNYFHFVCELMPKLHLIEQMGIDPNIPLLVSDDLDERLYKIIDALKDPARTIIKLKRHVPYAVANLTYLSDLSNVTDVYDAKPEPNHTFLPEAVIAEMAKKLKGGIVAGRTGGRKIYLPRDTKRRSILNERAVVEAMLQDNFEIVNLESMTFAAQLSLFSSASVIIGGTGAAFTNLLWCQPGVKAVILYPDHAYNNTTFWDRIGRISGMQIFYVQGARSERVQGIYAMHDDFTIDIAKLREALV